MKLSSLAKVLFACLILGSMAYGQGVADSGDIAGTVTDPSNAVVANATVTVNNAGNREECDCERRADEHCGLPSASVSEHAND